VVDAHMHLWDPDHLPRKWLGGIPLLNKPHLTSTVDEEAKIPPKTSASFVPPNIEAIVYVETDVPPAYSLLETEWVVSKLAAEDKRIQGIVASAPLEDGDDVRKFLEALVRIGKGGTFGGSNDAQGRQLVKGVRRLIQSESAEFCVQPSFVRGVKMLAEYNLSFDICCRPSHLDNVILLVSECPDTHFVLDHMGKPTISPSDAGFEHWSNMITNLAKLPNVYCKLSGLVVEAHATSGSAWKPADLQRYASHVFQAFGTSRVMFGSDWPVMKVAGVSYNEWLDIAASLVSSLTDEEKRLVWNGNAKKFYKL